MTSRARPSVPTTLLRQRDLQTRLANRVQGCWQRPWRQISWTCGPRSHASSDEHAVAASPAHLFEAEVAEQPHRVVEVDVREIALQDPFQQSRRLHGDDLTDRV